MRIADKTLTKNESSNDQKIIDWLLEGDAAIRWQVMQDLGDFDQALVENERSLVAETGWGARFLSFQEPTGLWAGGIYSPKWISTTYTMLTLRRLGLGTDHPQARGGCKLLLDHGYYTDGGINISKSEKQSEACVTGMVLSILAYFHYPDDRMDDLATHLLERQMDDGGWNCQDYKGDMHSSFHTTISVLEGLLEYQKHRRNLRMDIETARLRGHEFLLKHRLFRSDHTGEVVNKRMLRMPYPPRWFYDVFRALDYFQDYFRWMSGVEIEFRDDESVILDHKHQNDERFEDGIGELIKKRKPDGRWNMMRGPSGKVYFEMEQAGRPSRWNTLRGLRVLKWWEGDR